jgi:hypothetical protein
VLPIVTGEPGDAPDELNLDPRERAALLAWVGENLPLVRRSAVGSRIQYWAIGVGVGLGLIAHVGGFLLKTTTTAEPLALLADLLYTLGLALWTGIVVVLFVEVWPQSKKRQFKQALTAYEAAKGRTQPPSPPTAE